MQPFLYLVNPGRLARLDQAEIWTPFQKAT